MFGEFFDLNAQMFRASHLCIYYSTSLAKFSLLFTSPNAITRLHEISSSLKKRLLISLFLGRCPNEEDKRWDEVAFETRARGRLLHKKEKAKEGMRGEDAHLFTEAVPAWYNYPIYSLPNTHTFRDNKHPPQKKSFDLDIPCLDEL